MATESIFTVDLQNKKKMAFCQLSARMSLKLHHQFQKHKTNLPQILLQIHNTNIIIAPPIAGKQWKM